MPQSQTSADILAACDRLRQLPRSRPAALVCTPRGLKHLQVQLQPAGPDQPVSLLSGIPVHSAGSLSEARVLARSLKATGRRVWVLDSVLEEA